MGSCILIKFILLSRLDDPLPINEGSDYDGEGDVTLNSNISSHFHGSGEGVCDGGFLKGAGGAVKDG